MDDRYYMMEPGRPSYPERPNSRKPKRNWRKGICICLFLVMLGFSAFGIYSALGLGTAQTTAQPAADQQATGEEQTQTASDTEIQNDSILQLADSSGDNLTPEQVAEKVIPSVVCIQNLGENAQLSAEGSGIIISEDGYIATNAHVIEGAKYLKVILSNDETLDAEVIGSDEATDLAVIKIDKTGLTPAEFTDSDTMAVGEYVMAIGNPGGSQFKSSATLGIVSANNRPITLTAGYTMQSIQTDAAINPGNSGGPLVNMQGQVVGINSAKYAVSGYEGMGFAITSNDATPILNDLIEYGYVKSRAMLGITSLYVDEMQAQYYGMPGGMYVDEVNNEKAGGLQSGDMLTAIDGTEITSDSIVRSILNSKKPGETVEIEYYRKATGQSYQGTLTLVEYQGE